MDSPITCRGAPATHETGFHSTSKKKPHKRPQRLIDTRDDEIKIFFAPLHLKPWHEGCSSSPGVKDARHTTGDFSMHNFDPRHFHPRQTCVNRGQSTPLISDALYARLLAQERSGWTQSPHRTQSNPTATACCTTLFGLRTHVSGFSRASGILAGPHEERLPLYS